MWLRIMDTARLRVALNRKRVLLFALTNVILLSFMNLITAGLPVASLFP